MDGIVAVEAHLDRHGIHHRAYPGPGHGPVRPGSARPRRLDHRLDRSTPRSCEGNADGAGIDDPGVYLGTVTDGAFASGALTPASGPRPLRAPTRQAPESGAD